MIQLLPWHHKCVSDLSGHHLFPFFPSLFGVSYHYEQRSCSLGGTRRRGLLPVPWKPRNATATAAVVAVSAAAAPKNVLMMGESTSLGDGYGVLRVAEAHCLTLGCLCRRRLLRWYSLHRHVPRQDARGARARGDAFHPGTGPRFSADSGRHRCVLCKVQGSHQAHRWRSLGACLYRQYPGPARFAARGSLGPAFSSFPTRDRPTRIAPLVSPPSPEGLSGLHPHPLPLTEGSSPSPLRRRMSPT